MSKKLNEITGHKVAGLTIDLMSKLRDGVIDVEELERFLTLSPMERKKFLGVEEDAILKLISVGERISIGACDGTETMAKAGKFFKSYLDPDFKNWGTDKPGITTAETTIEVREMVKDATFAQMFGSLGTDLNKLCLTQHQIKKFCAEHADWLRKDGYATFFLFKVDEQFFVANVNVNSDGLNVNVNRLENDNVWNAECRHCVVTPKL